MNNTSRLFCSEDQFYFYHSLGQNSKQHVKYYNNNININNKVTTACKGFSDSSHVENLIFGTAEHSYMSDIHRLNSHIVDHDWHLPHLAACGQINPAASTVAAVAVHKWSNVVVYGLRLSYHVSCQM